MIIDELNKVNMEGLLSEGTYYYGDYPVPRVTEILSSMLHEEYLMKWANNIGLYQRKRYTDERDRAAFIGTNAHNNIEYYVQNKVFKECSQETSKDTNILKSINNAVQSFIVWYNDVFSSNEVEVIGIEQKLSCPWFGGTYDMLLKINGKIYLIDFKTSNHVSYKYWMQIAAYKYMLSCNGINLDGAVILQLDKKDIFYSEYVLNFDNQEHNDFINLCTNGFLSLVYAYNNRVLIEKQYKEIF